MKQRAKRLISILLILCMVLPLMPISPVRADSGETKLIKSENIKNETMYFNEDKEITYSVEANAVSGSAIEFTWWLTYDSGVSSNINTDEIYSVDSNESSSTLTINSKDVLFNPGTYSYYCVLSHEGKKEESERGTLTVTKASPNLPDLPDLHIKSEKEGSYKLSLTSPDTSMQYSASVTSDPNSIIPVSDGLELTQLEEEIGGYNFPTNDWELTINTNAVEAGKSAVISIRLKSNDFYEEQVRTLTVNTVDKISLDIDTSGMTCEDKIYDGETWEFTGAPKAAGYSGAFTYDYTGTAANGSAYRSTNPPTNTGDYVLTIIPDSEVYSGSTCIDFKINKREVRVIPSPENVIFYRGDSLTMISIHYYGFIGEDVFLCISNSDEAELSIPNTDVPGTYVLDFSKEAELNNNIESTNYYLTHISGILTVSDKYGGMDVLTCNLPDTRINNAGFLTASVDNSVASHTFDFTVSTNATWTLYKNFDSSTWKYTDEIADKRVDLMVGENIFYLKVDAEHGYSSRRYEVRIIRRDEGEYGISVGGVAVTESNKDNISGEGIDSGTISYDPDTNTLTLNNAVIAGETRNIITAIYIDIREVNIKLVGNSRLGAVVASQSQGDASNYTIETGIYSVGSVNISGSGRLEIYDGDTGIEADDIIIDLSGSGSIKVIERGTGLACCLKAYDSLTINGGSLDFNSYISNGIYGLNRIEINGGAITIMAQNMADNNSYAFNRSPVFGANYKYNVYAGENQAQAIKLTNAGDADFESNNYIRIEPINKKPIPSIIPPYTPPTTDTPAPGSQTPSDENTSPNDTVEYSVDGSGNESWNKVIDELEAGEVTNIRVKLTGTTSIPDGLLKELMGKDKSLTLELGDGISWTIKGKDLENNEKEASSPDSGTMDLGVDLGKGNIPKELLEELLEQNELGSSDDLLLLSLSHTGSFGFKASLSVYIGKDLAGKTGNIFYYNEDSGKLELVAMALVDAEGYGVFPFSHASDYVIAIDDGETLQAEMEKLILESEIDTLYVGGNIGRKTALELKLPESLNGLTKEDSLYPEVSYTSSSNKAVFVSSRGLVTGINPGKATITAVVTIGGLSKTLKTDITVEEASIELVKEKSSLKKGASFTYKAIGHGVSPDKVSWNTTKKSIVVINKKTGKAVAKSRGTDYVVAKYGTIKRVIKVTVK